MGTNLEIKVFKRALVWIRFFSQAPEQLPFLITTCYLKSIGHCQSLSMRKAIHLLKQFIVQIRLLLKGCISGRYYHKNRNPTYNDCEACRPIVAVNQQIDPICLWTDTYFSFELVCSRDWWMPKLGRWYASITGNATTLAWHMKSWWWCVFLLKCGEVRQFRLSLSG